MKLDAISVAAVAVAGLAVATWARNRNPVTAASGQASVDYFGQATAQRRASGAAVSQNTSYLADWQQYGSTQPDF